MTKLNKPITWHTPQAEISPTDINQQETAWRDTWRSMGQMRQTKTDPMMPQQPNYISTGTWVGWHIVGLFTFGIVNIITAICWLSYRSRLRSYQIQLMEYNIYKEQTKREMQSSE